MSKKTITCKLVSKSFFCELNAGKHYAARWPKRELNAGKHYAARWPKRELNAGKHYAARWPKRKLKSDTRKE